MTEEETAPIQTRVQACVSSACLAALLLMLLLLLLLNWAERIGVYEMITFKLSMHAPVQRHFVFLLFITCLHPQVVLRVRPVLPHESANDVAVTCNSEGNKVQASAV